jgi:hypothetical protein
MSSSFWRRAWRFCGLKIRANEGYVLVKRSASNTKDSWLVIPERKKAID